MKKIICVALVLVFALGCFAFVGCNRISDNTEHYDAITKKLKLSKSYEGKDFITEGIGAATLLYTTDGDTTTFKLIPSEVSVTIRYHGIDTPESTGGVEKWGKAASLFNKNCLDVPGTEYVLEATGPRAVPDSYGVRYLGYVWYRNPGQREFKCLNLEMVENGFSENKCVNTSEFPYFAQFDEAEQFAKSVKTRLYSDLDDPLFSTDPVDITLKEFEERPDLFYTEETDSGAKVRFQAVLTAVRINNTYTFTAVQFDDDGTMHTIDVYAGYPSATASTMEVGHLYRIVGNVQKHNSKFQISGIQYSEIFGGTNPSYTTPVQRNYYLTFDSQMDYVANYYSTLYTDITVVSASVANNELTIVGTAQQRRKNGPLETVVTFTFKVPVAQGYTNTFNIGDKFSVNGYQYEENSKQITIKNYSDISKR